MLKNLIKKEILSGIQSMRFLITTLLCLVLIPLGVYVNLKDYERRLDDYQEATRLYEQRSRGNIDLDFPAEGFRPPSPLSIFSIGLEYFLPTKVTTSRDAVFRTANESGINNAQSLLFGKIDLLFNVSFVISLLALILSFNAISGEKEDGTLRLMLSNPIARSKILIGKLVGNSVLLLVPFLLSIIIALIVLSNSQIISVFSPAIMGPFFAILIVTLLFILLMFNLGILISSLTHRSNTSIIALLFVWTICVLTLPKISPMVAEIIYPVKSQQVINLQKMLVRQNLERELDKKRRELFDRMKTELGISTLGASVPGRTPEERGANAKYDDAKRPLDLEYNQKIAAEMKKVDEEYAIKRNTQAAISMTISRISPVSSYTYIVSELAATGVLEMNNLMQNADRFQTEVKENIYDKFIVKSYGGTGGGTATSITYEKGFDPEKIDPPRLNYHTIGFVDALQAEWLDILLILLFNVLLFAACYLSFLRYDAR